MPRKFSPCLRSTTCSALVSLDLGRHSREVRPETAIQRAPFPVELAEQLGRMFSFAGDRVLDPFMGQGSTNIAAVLSGRNSLGNELEKAFYFESGVE